MKHIIKPIILLIFYLIIVPKGNCQSITKYIIVDQFGYLPDAKKIAVIKDPVTGFDGSKSFVPGNTYRLMDVDGTSVFEDQPLAWSNGSEDPTSGDKVWWFDFSSVTEPGTYYVLDVEKNKRSFNFIISKGVYNGVLKHAVRTFFYQRAGHEKRPPYADAAWEDGASHIGPLQDKNARLFNDKNNAATERDLHGGWYDAGDYNKYTSWTANYVVEMMLAYLERPEAWSDDYNIPESGNGIPDLLDEAKWGLDHLLRMQNEDGSVLSIVGLSHASPPSSATGQSLYGPANTSATLNTAAAFAIASKVYGMINLTQYADQLRQSAEKAWVWADANPNVLFKNNDAAYGSSGLGAGQQETDDYGRSMAKLRASCFLFEATGKTVYKDHFDANYVNSNFFKWSHAYPFESSTQDALLHYIKIPNSTETVAQTIANKYKSSMNGTDNFQAFTNNVDPYRAHIKDYTWGSNSTKARQGSMFYSIITKEMDATKNEDARHAAMGFINYIHGVNPLNMVYLSNMYKNGGDFGVNEFYHTWFQNGSAKWDRVGQSTFGPAPGFLTGGPNPSYNWDGCCPSGCGGSANNAVCTSESISPPKDQPKQKSYKDFNTSWPLNSWSVTENSCGYQVDYIRLLSKFVNPGFDCNSELNGSAYLDKCGICVGGSTGKQPSNTCEELVTGIGKMIEDEIIISPNPTGKEVYISGIKSQSYNLEIVNMLGLKMNRLKISEDTPISLENVPQGVYIFKLSNGDHELIKKVVKN